MPIPSASQRSAGLFCIEVFGHDWFGRQERAHTIQDNQATLREDAFLTQQSS